MIATKWETVVVQVYRDTMLECVGTMTPDAAQSLALARIARGIEDVIDLASEDGTCATPPTEGDLLRAFLMAAKNQREANAECIVCPALLAALQRIADDTSAVIARQRVETPTSLLDLHETVISVQIRAREALAHALLR
jgi:hypothetical protein